MGLNVGLVGRGVGGKVRIFEKIVTKTKSQRGWHGFWYFVEGRGVGGAGWVASGHWRLCCHSPLTMVGKRPSARYQIGRALDFGTGLRDLDGLG